MKPASRARAREAHDRVVRSRTAPALPLLLLLLAGVPAWPRALAAQDSCNTCHSALGNPRLSDPATTFPEDIHAKKGFTCVACHGGDPSMPGFDAMDPAKGFIGRPTRQAIPQLCGRCHSDANFMKRYNPSLRVDQVAEYRTSVHGRRLARGDRRVATCVSCHPAHSIRPPADPTSSVHALNVAHTCGRCHADSAYMAPYHIPTDQLAKYETSVHWHALSEQHDLGAPTCNDCHGNHGATPPGISWVGYTCGQCHSVMEDLFRKTVHAAVFPGLGQAGCAACHGNHDVHTTSDTMLGLGPGAVCARCHDAESWSGEQAVTMRHLVDSLRDGLDSATTLLQRAERAGVEVSQGLFELQAARTALVSARTAVHAASTEAVQQEVDSGLEVTGRAFERGRRAFRELRFRRTGLAISVTIILVLIVGLVLKIRELEGSA